MDYSASLSLSIEVAIIFPSLFGKLMEAGEETGHDNHHFNAVLFDCESLCEQESMHFPTQRPLEN